MAAVIDLDARRAQRAEAAGEPIDVRLGGDVFTFPTVREWPVDLADVLSRGDLMGGLRLLLPPDDFDRFMGHRPTLGDLSDLFDGLGKASGVGGMGNSPGSVTS
jgi:hypothetical protein